MRDLRCLPETNEIEYHERDPLVRWFELHGHLVSRANLAHIAAQNQRPLLRRALDSFGAEVIVPLYARGEIIGWLFFGHRITGLPFDYGDLEGLMILAEHVSTVLENALLYEEVTLQKTLAETLLKSIPPGIVAIDEDGIVRWFNPPAEPILGLKAIEVLNCPVEAVGRKLAAMLRETLEAKANLPPRQWIDPNTRRSLSVEARRLLDHHTPLGAVAVIHDLTAEENLRQKQDLVDRAAFWTDLAASMSHEIRNPLVAIKTFAQLLPERFDDPEFRKNFNQIVVQEIDRLDKIITQINAFRSSGGIEDETAGYSHAGKARARACAQQISGQRRRGGGNRIARQSTKDSWRRRGAGRSGGTSRRERGRSSHRTEKTEDYTFGQADSRRWPRQCGARDGAGQRTWDCAGNAREGFLSFLYNKSARHGIGSADRQTNRVRSQRSR